VLVSWATVLILVDLFIPEERNNWTILLAALGLLVTMIFVVARFRWQYVAVNGMLVVDGFADFLAILFLGSGLVSIALSYDYLKRLHIDRSEYYILMMFSISGMMLMAMTADLIVVF
jgi:NADH-quinone oxidoreductase subunit N